MGRRITAALAVTAIVWAIPVRAGPIARIEAPTPGLNGPAQIDFPPDTTLDDFGPMPMVSFEGTWVNGVAQGDGLVRFADTPSQTMPDKVSPGGPNYYVGQFEAGLPRGPGKLVQTTPPDYLAPVEAHTQTIDGPYSGQQVTMLADDQPVAVYTKLQSEPATLVNLMQYPSFDAASPSRICYGKADASGVNGQWADVPWFRQMSDGVMLAGFGQTVDAFFPDGGSQKCTVPVPADNPFTLRQLMGQSFPGDQRKAALDPRLSSASAECVTTSANGWTWSFSVDNTVNPPAVRYRECRLPSGSRGRLTNGGRSCEEREGRKFDVLTNIGREFRRFVERDIVGNIDRAGAGVERAMCRATGTEPGVNCNISVQVGASWPVGDGPAPGLPPSEQAARQAFLAAAKKANAIADAMAGKGPVGEAAALTAGLNAICSSLCAEQGQRTYSASLLSELEAVAPQPLTDENVLIISRVNRETASVARVLQIAVVAVGLGGTAAVSISDYTKSIGRMSRIQKAMDLVNQSDANAMTLRHLKQSNMALASLVALQKAEANRAALEGVRIIAAPITSSLKVLSGIPVSRRAALMAAIQMGRNSEQVKAFMDKYQDVKTEEELQEAIIKEALAPLGISWPPADH